ncbi:GntR family transcriptional regulator [Bradyrhizobium sp. CCGUVB1N3]|uniref:GntR family transcriptional regulator n=1 Tax=Bradyrhizobium sp. CCGUVB1N3 TaxID=2949629 RepID=UPI0020B279AF|nr:GntR family transcriptional regulator [Bradyrhizobium sp. CCGUVB1N3]MCP3468929.1 GntR family transcriptional regulator [Bradyrhizobium sp. CCGUVB1N3]
MPRRPTTARKASSRHQPSSDVSVLLAPTEKSLSQLAYERILDLLVKRELPAGTVMQERRLAEFLDISRTPIREALYRLETEGLVARAPGNSLIVKEFSLHEFIEILQVRRVLEAEAAVLSINRIASPELDDVEAHILRLRERGDPNTPENREIDRRFHELLAENSGNAVLAGLIRDLRLKTQMFNLSRLPERFIPVHNEHLAIIAALRAKDPAAIRAGIDAHIENIKLSIMRKLGAIG